MEQLDQIIKQQHQSRPYRGSVDSFSSESFINYSNFVRINQSNQVATPSGDVDKQRYNMETKSIRVAPSYGSLSNTFTISFGNHTSPREIDQYQHCGESELNYPDALKAKEETNLEEFIGSMNGIRRVRSTRRNHRQAHEHVLAERKRREKLAERFISLSSLLPGLKKMDKATMLDDARNYIIQLQTRVKELEEILFKFEHIIHGSVVSMGTTKLSGCCEDAASSSDTNYLRSSSIYDPEIKARISGNKILLRIYCRKSSSLVLKTLNEMDRLHITITCCNIIPFDTSHLINITAQMSDGMVMKAKDIVKYLRPALN